MAEQQAPGAEFLLRRLARVEAVPPAERQPEVAAFVESLHLLREVCQLLPLTSDSQPALPADSPAKQQQVQLAFLKFAWASYVLPVLVHRSVDVDWSSHLLTYLSFVTKARFLMHITGSSRAAVAAAALVAAAATALAAAEGQLLPQKAPSLKHWRPTFWQPTSPLMKTFK